MKKVSYIVLLAMLAFLAGCAAPGKAPQQSQVAVPAIAPLTYSPNDSSLDVARDIAAQFPQLSAFHPFRQTSASSTDQIDSAGVIATQNGNQVHLEYRNRRQLFTPHSHDEVTTSTFCDVTVIPIQGLPGKFSVVFSLLSERVGHLLFIPFKPLAPIDQIAADIGSTFSKLRPSYIAQTNSRLRQDAENGKVSAQFALGAAYDAGLGVPQSYADAANWYRRAADQGDPDAQNMLGAKYTRGQGVPSNFAEAVKWFSKAVEQGHVEAMNNLGAMYANGDGVVQDYTHAYKWWIVAKAGAKQGSEAYITASRLIDNYASRMAPIQIARAQQEASAWMSAHAIGR